jgi:hypothetical protein
MEQVIVKLQEWIALYGLKVIAALAILYRPTVAKTFNYAENLNF